MSAISCNKLRGRKLTIREVAVGGGDGWRAALGQHVCWGVCLRACVAAARRCGGAAARRCGGAACLPSAHSTLAPRSVCAMASCLEARGKPYSCCMRPEMYRPEKQPKRTWDAMHALAA